MSSSRQSALVSARAVRQSSHPSVRPLGAKKAGRNLSRHEYARLSQNLSASDFNNSGISSYIFLPANVSAVARPRSGRSHQPLVRRLIVQLGFSKSIDGSVGVGIEGPPVHHSSEQSEAICRDQRRVPPPGVTSIIISPNVSGAGRRVATYPPPRCSASYLLPWSRGRERVPQQGTPQTSPSR